MRRQNADDYAHRFAVYYARRTARDASELLAGYFNHEDPRPRVSGEAATGKRIRSALLSVLVVKSDEGSRPAFAPLSTSTVGRYGAASLVPAPEVSPSLPARGAWIETRRRHIGELLSGDGNLYVAITARDAHMLKVINHSLLLFPLLQTLFRLLRVSAH